MLYQYVILINVFGIFLLYIYNIYIYIYSCYIYMFFFNYYLDISQVNLRYNNETNVNTQEIRMFLCRSSTSLH